MVTNRHPHVLATLLALIWLNSSGSSVVASEPGGGYDWCAESGYLPPDYDRFFPDDAAGAAALAALWASPDLDNTATSLLLETVRRGLRRYDGNRAELLRWLGQRFVEGRLPQSAEALEIMYHALDLDLGENGGAATRSAALRFGVSLVRPLPPNVLRALAAYSIASEDGDDLGRIVWAVSDQRDEAVAVLEDYALDTDSVDREKVAVVRRLWNRELKAHDWARERKLARAREAFGDRLTGILGQLASGPSEERKQALAFVLENDLLLLLPESALDSLSRCASDADPEVRALAARLVGERWVLAASYVPPRAVDILLALSRDEVALVCQNAIQFGLSALSPKEDVVVIRLMEVAATQSDTPLYDQIVWGLRSSQPQVKAQLDAWRISKDPARVALSLRLARDLLHRS